MTPLTGLLRIYFFVVLPSRSTAESPLTRLFDIQNLKTLSLSPYPLSNKFDGPSVIASKQRPKKIAFFKEESYLILLKE